MNVYEGNYPKYLAADWPGPLPVGNNKALLVKGFTGKIHKGAYPSEEQCQEWADHELGQRMIGLRMPETETYAIVGIDTDDYEDKNGAAEIAAKEALWGSLPDTYSSTARGPRQPSRIRFYKAPVGLEWPGQVPDCPSVEMISPNYRYSNVPPSIHPDLEGDTYKWYGPDGEEIDYIPRPDDMAWLPDTWISGITGGEAEVILPTVDLSAEDVTRWLSTRPAGTMCREMSAQVARTKKELKGNGHGALVRGLYSMVNLAAEGHSGVVEALTWTEENFGEEVADRRKLSAMESEFDRARDGAVRKAVARGIDSPSCWCHINLEPTRAEALPEFPTQALPGTVRSIVEASASNLRMRADIPAMFAVGTLSAAVQGRLDVQVEGWGARPAIAWTFTLADAGSAKSPAARHITGPFSRLEQEIRVKERAKVVTYKMTVEELRKRIEKKEKAVEFDGELHQMKVRLAELEDNPLADCRLTVDDITPESLAKVMNSQGGRLALITPEGHVLQSAMGMRYGGGSDPNITGVVQAYDKETSSRDRVDESKSFKVYEPALTLSAAMQPDIVRDKGAFTDGRVRASGFLVRALWSMPEADISKVTRGRPVPVSEVIANEWGSLLSDIILRFRDLKMAAVLTMSEDAEDLFWARDEICQKKARGKDEAGFEAQYYSKFMDKVARVAALLHLARVGATAVLDEGDTVIDAGDVRAALAICDYSMAHFKRIFELDGFDQHDEDMVTLLKGVKKFLLKENATKGELRVYKKVLRRGSNAWNTWPFERLYPALNRIAEAGLARIESNEASQISFFIKAEDILSFLENED